MEINASPIISVIIPIYNTEKFLKRCLNSIINQTYSHLEIICVNDASPGNAKEIVEEYMQNDDRIKYIEHSDNKGLYHARISGSELATGQFIAFVDSDDYISIDFYRLLITKALKEKSDIVEGRIIRENEDGQKFIQNFNNVLPDVLIGDEIKEAFFSQEGLFYHWHVIWNKIYSKKLWDQCVPYYKKQTEHLIMTEDLLFSSLLFFNATKYSSIKYDGYFYYIRADAATGSDSEINKFLKTFSDMATAFDFVESYIQSLGGYENYEKNIINWKKRYGRLWASRIKSTPFSHSTKKQAINELRKQLRFDSLEDVQPDDYFHSLVNTPWNSGYEDLKSKVASKDFDYISFDILDTLVVRPFYDPMDLFHLLDDYFHQIYPKCQMVEFSKLRFQAEARARNLIGVSNPSWQDVNLDEIYTQIYNEYHLPSDVLDKLKAKEIEFEIKFTNKRESIFELFNMARILNKKIILVSDMYLSEKVMKDILEKSGYVGYERLYVSSETRLLKNTGDMFTYVSNDLGVDPNRILHIGDNWNSDKINAEKKGWNAVYVPKTIELLNKNGDIINSFLDDHPNKWTSYERLEYTGIRCMLAVVANTLFDNPFPSFNSDSDFNMDPYFIGYYALGMHTFGLSKWILEDSFKKEKDTIHFIARDGYLPYRIYQILASFQSDAPKADYIYASRKSLLPYLLLSHDVYGFESLLSIFAHTPNSVLKMLGAFLKDDIESKSLEDRGIILSKKFSSQYEFKKFIDVLMQVGIDKRKVEDYVENLKQYYNSLIGPNDATFDLGYSARLQAIIVNLIQRKCDTYFVHTSKEIPWRYSKRNNFELNSYYEFKPNISGILREHLFAELGPSCVSFEKSQIGTIIPVFEEYRENSINKLMVSTMQKGAIDFAVKIMEVFNGHMDLLNVRSSEVSIPLELFIHSSKMSDRLIFKHSSSDDTVHGANENNSILKWWNNEANLQKVNSLQVAPAASRSMSDLDFLYNRSKYVKGIFFALFDRETLKAKVKARYEGKPVTLKILTLTYSSFRKIKRMIKPIH